MNNFEEDFPIPIDLTDYKFNIGDLFEDNTGKTVEVVDRFESHFKPKYIIFIKAYEMEELFEFELEQYKLIKHINENDRKEFITNIKNDINSFSDYKFELGTKISVNNITYVISNRECIPCYLNDAIVYVSYYSLSKENKELLYVDENTIINDKRFICHQ